MNASGQRFSVIPGRWAIARLPPESPLPQWAMPPAEFASVTRTKDELSIVCPAEKVPEAVQAEADWALIKVHGPFAFNEVGILASFAAPLAEAGIGIFTISTFDTDYILVKAQSRDAACAALQSAGHRLAGGGPVLPS